MCCVVCSPTVDNSKHYLYDITKDDFTWEFEYPTIQCLVDALSIEKTMKLKLFKFINNHILDDLVDDKGKVIAYKKIAIIARSENHARSIYQWKLPNDEYNVVAEQLLNKDWDLPVGKYFQDYLFKQ